MIIYLPTWLVLTYVPRYVAEEPVEKVTNLSLSNFKAIFDYIQACHMLYSC